MNTILLLIKSYIQSGLLQLEINDGQNVYTVDNPSDLEVNLGKSEPSTCNPGEIVHDAGCCESLR